MKFCKDCQHFSRSVGHASCGRKSQIDPVNEELLPMLMCYQERSELSGDRCGPEGKYFVRKKSLSESMLERFRGK